MKLSPSQSSRLLDPAADISPEAFETIRRIVKNHKGFRLDHYKNACIRRRIAIRLRATHCSSADEYCNLLITEPEERDRLLKVLTIHVSQFYRNPSTFSLLEETIFPYLLTRSREKEGRQIRIWSVGCAGGEEPYTLALILKESFAAHLEQCPVSLLATDVDKSTLSEARQAVFGPERLREVPQAIRDRWFTEHEGLYRLAPEIREMVEFREGDLCMRGHWPACDLILCRNVLIYFERNEQERILHAFADALGSGGILVLGKAETLSGKSRSLYQSISLAERVYRVQ